eukprot:g5098.t1
MTSNVAGITDDVLSRAILTIPEHQRPRMTVKLERGRYEKGLMLKNERGNKLYATLRKLSLKSNGMKSLQTIERCPKITFLKCDDNEIDEDGLVPAYSLQELATFNASMNCLTRIPKGIERLSVLKALVLTGNQLTDISALKDAQLKSLNTLVLSKNMLTSDAFSKNSGILKSLPALETLSLSHNQLTEFPFVKANSLLSILRLNNNKIEDLPVFKRAGILKLVDLGNNSIPDWQTLPRLAKLSLLKNLTLRGNPAASDISTYASMLETHFSSVAIIDGSAHADTHRKRLERRKAYANGSSGTAASTRDAPPKRPRKLRDVSKEMASVESTRAATRDGGDKNVTVTSTKRKRDAETAVSVRRLEKAKKRVEVPGDETGRRSGATRHEDEEALLPSSNKIKEKKKKKKKKKKRGKKKKMKEAGSDDISNTTEKESNVADDGMDSGGGIVVRPQKRTEEGVSIGVTEIQTHRRPRGGASGKIAGFLHSGPKGVGLGGASAW